MPDFKCAFPVPDPSAGCLTSGPEVPPSGLRTTPTTVKEKVEMNRKRRSRLPLFTIALFGVAATLVTATALAQFPDKTRNPNAANEGINKSLTQQIGAGRGNNITPDSSAFIIARDPFRAVRRGRQLFQRKFLRGEGMGQSQVMATAKLISDRPDYRCGLADSQWLVMDYRAVQRVLWRRGSDLIAATLHTFCLDPRRCCRRNYC